MGILKERVNDVFKRYSQDDFNGFVKGLVEVGDVRYQWHRNIVDNVMPIYHIDIPEEIDYYGFLHQKIYRDSTLIITPRLDDTSNSTIVRCYFLDGDYYINEYIMYGIEDDEYYRLGMQDPYFDIHLVR